MKVNDALFPVILDMALGYPAKYGIKRPKKGILRQITDSSVTPLDFRRWLLGKVAGHLEASTAAS